jgi:hypothetical protein
MFYFLSQFSSIFWIIYFYEEFCFVLIFFFYKLYIFLFFDDIEEFFPMMLQ